MSNNVRTITVVDTYKGFGIDNRGHVRLDDIQEILNNLQGVSNRDEDWDKQFKEACGLLDVYIKNQNRNRKADEDRRKKIK